MGYLNEFREKWRPLLAAALGMGSGLSLNAYMGSVFAPHVMREFGWTPAQYAVVGTAGLFLLVTIPFIGRLTDLFGVRKVATVGVIGYPLTFLLFSFTDDSFWTFFGIFCLQNLVAGTTTAAVYSRIVAQNFDKARGMALAIAVSGPALIGATASILLTDVILAHGWRTAYQVAGAVFLVTGITALAIMPPSVINRTAREHPGSGAKRDYGFIFRSPPFWIILFAMVLANTCHSLTATQLSPMLIDSGATIEQAARLASFYAAGVIGGRLACGYLLDRFPAHLVAGVSHVLPAIGMFLIGSSLDTYTVLALGLLFVGIAIGAEGDIAGFVIVRIFGIGIYGSVFGLVAAGVGLASASGALLLSKSIQATGSFAFFVNANGIAILVSALLFLTLGRYMKRPQEHQEPQAPKDALACEA